MLPFERYRALTFDCYGTLVDWEAGILGALRPVVDRHGAPCEDERLLTLYAAAESEIETAPYAPYRDVLRAVVLRLAGTLGFRPDAAEVDGLAASLPDWPPFPDTLAALRALGRRYRLAIVSNVDDDLFAGTARRLGVEGGGVAFDVVVTASQVKSYKPAPVHFETALARLGLGPGEVLHVAQSLYHDIAPARALGLATVWVNRRAGRAGAGATPPAEARPDLEVPDLASLAAMAAPAA